MTKVSLKYYLAWLVSNLVKYSRMNTSNRCPISNMQFNSIRTKFVGLNAQAQAVHARLYGCYVTVKGSVSN